MGSFTYSLSLWAQHADADLSDIAAHLDLTSNRLWKKGEARKAPNGRIQGGNYKESFCGMRIAHNESGDLQKAVEATLEKLKSEREFIKEMRSQGVSFSFNIGLFMNDNSCGELFDLNTLTDMTDLGIALGLNIYAPEETEEDGTPNA